MAQSVRPNRQFCPGRWRWLADSCSLLLGLEVLRGLGLPLDFHGVDNAFVLPSDFVGQSGDGSVFAVGAQFKHLHAIWHYHSLLFVIWFWHAIENLQTVESFRASVCGEAYLWWPSGYFGWTCHAWAYNAIHLDYMITSMLLGLLLVTSTRRRFLLNNWVYVVYYFKYF